MLPSPLSEAFCKGRINEHELWGQHKDVRNDKACNSKTYACPPRLHGIAARNASCRKGSQGNRGREVCKHGKVEAEHMGRCVRDPQLKQCRCCNGGRDDVGRNGRKPHAEDHARHHGKDEGKENGCLAQTDNGICHGQAKTSLGGHANDNTDTSTSHCHTDGLFSSIG